MASSPSSLHCPVSDHGSRNGCGQLGSAPCCSPTTTQKACDRAQVLAGMQAWHQSQVSAGINHAGSHTGVPMTPYGPGQSKDSNRCPQTLYCSVFLSLPTTDGAALLRLRPQRPSCVRISAAPEKLCAKSSWTRSAVSVSCLWQTSFVRKHPSCLV